MGDELSRRLCLSCIKVIGSASPCIMEGYRSSSHPPLTSTVILEYSSLPVPLQLQSHAFDIAFPLPASPSQCSPHHCWRVGLLCQRHLLLLLSSLFIFILDRRSVPAVCSCSHTNTHTRAVKRKLKHTPAERNPVGAWLMLTPRNIRPSFWCSLLTLRTRHILTHNHLHPQRHYTHTA